MEQRITQLSANDFLEGSVLTLLQALATAEDDFQAVSQCKINLFFKHFGGLVVVAAALAVTQDDIAGTRRCHHGGRHLAGVGAAGVVGAVLGGKAHVGVTDGFAHGGQVGERHADNDVALQVSLGSHCCTHVLGELYALGNCGIHLPVSRNNVLSHFLSSCLNDRMWVGYLSEAQS